MESRISHQDSGTVASKCDGQSHPISSAGLAEHHGLASTSSLSINNSDFEKNLSSGYSHNNGHSPTVSHSRLQDQHEVESSTVMKKNKKEEAARKSAVSEAKSVQPKRAKSGAGDEQQQQPGTETGPDDSAPSVRRPMNAYILFCKRNRAAVREANPELDNRGVTRLLGDLWSKLGPEKATYTNLAKQNKEAFLKANPNYKWSGERSQSAAGKTGKTTQSGTKSAAREATPVSVARLEADSAAAKSKPSPPTPQSATTNTTLLQPTAAASTVPQSNSPMGNVATGISGQALTTVTTDLNRSGQPHALLHLAEMCTKSPPDVKIPLETTAATVSKSPSGLSPLSRSSDLISPSSRASDIVSPPGGPSHHMGPLKKRARHWSNAELDNGDNHHLTQTPSMGFVQGQAVRPVIIQHQPTCDSNGEKEFIADKMGNQVSSFSPGQPRSEESRISHSAGQYRSVEQDVEPHPMLRNYPIARKGDNFALHHPDRDSTNPLNLSVSRVQQANLEPVLTSERLARSASHVTYTYGDPQPPHTTFGETYASVERYKSANHRYRKVSSSATESIPSFSPPPFPPGRGSDSPPTLDHSNFSRHGNKDPSDTSAKHVHGGEKYFTSAQGAASESKLSHIMSSSGVSLPSSSLLSKPSVVVQMMMQPHQDSVVERSSHGVAYHSGVSHAGVCDNGARHPQHLQQPLPTCKPDTLCRLLASGVTTSSHGNHVKRYGPDFQQWRDPSSPVLNKPQPIRGLQASPPLISGGHQHHVPLVQVALSDYTASAPAQPHVLPPPKPSHHPPPSSVVQPLSYPAKTVPTSCLSTSLTQGKVSNNVPLSSSHLFVPISKPPATGTQPYDLPETSSRMPERLVLMPGEKKPFLEASNSISTNVLHPSGKAPLMSGEGKLKKKWAQRVLVEERMEEDIRSRQRAQLELRQANEMSILGQGQVISDNGLRPRDSDLKRPLLPSGPNVDNRPLRMDPAVGVTALTLPDSPVGGSRLQMFAAGFPTTSQTSPHSASTDRQHNRMGNSENILTYSGKSSPPVLTLQHNLDPSQGSMGGCPDNTMLAHRSSAAALLTSQTQDHLSNKSVPSHKPSAPSVSSARDVGGSSARDAVSSPTVQASMEYSSRMPVTTNTSHITPLLLSSTTTSAKPSILSSCLMAKQPLEAVKSTMSNLSSPIRSFNASSHPKLMLQLSQGLASSSPSLSLPPQTSALLTSPPNPMSASTFSSPNLPLSSTNKSMVEDAAQPSHSLQTRGDDQSRSLQTRGDDQSRSLPSREYDQSHSVLTRGQNHQPVPAMTINLGAGGWRSQPIEEEEGYRKETHLEGAPSNLALVTADLSNRMDAVRSAAPLLEGTYSKSSEDGNVGQQKSGTVKPPRGQGKARKEKKKVIEEMKDGTLNLAAGETTVPPRVRKRKKDKSGGDMPLKEGEKVGRRSRRKPKAEETSLLSPAMSAGSTTPPGVREGTLTAKREDNKIQNILGLNPIAACGKKMVDHIVEQLYKSSELSESGSDVAPTKVKSRSKHQPLPVPLPPSSGNMKELPDIKPVVFPMKLDNYILSKSNGQEENVHFPIKSELENTNFDVKPDVTKLQMAGPITQWGGVTVERGDTLFMKKPLSSADVKHIPGAGCIGEERLINSQSHKLFSDIQESQGWGSSVKREETAQWSTPVFGTGSKREVKAEGVDSKQTVFVGQPGHTAWLGATTRERQLFPACSLVERVVREVCGSPQERRGCYSCQTKEVTACGMDNSTKQEAQRSVPPTVAHGHSDFNSGSSIGADRRANVWNTYRQTNDSPTNDESTYKPMFAGLASASASPSPSPSPSPSVHSATNPLLAYRQYHQSHNNNRHHSLFAGLASASASPSPSPSPSPSVHSATNPLLAYRQYHQSHNNNRHHSPHGGGQGQRHGEWWRGSADKDDKNFAAQERAAGDGRRDMTMAGLIEKHLERQKAREEENEKQKQQRLGQIDEDEEEEEEEECRPLRKSRRANKGQKYEKLIKEGFIQPSRDRLVSRSFEQERSLDSLPEERSAEVGNQKSGAAANRKSALARSRRLRREGSRKSLDSTPSSSSCSSPLFNKSAAEPNGTELSSGISRKEDSVPYKTDCKDTCNIEPQTTALSQAAPAVVPAVTGSRKRKARKHCITRISVVGQESPHDSPATTNPPEAKRNKPSPSAVTEEKLPAPAVSSPPVLLSPACMELITTAKAEDRQTAKQKLPENAPLASQTVPGLPEVSGIGSAEQVKSEKQTLQSGTGNKQNGVQSLSSANLPPSTGALVEQRARPKILEKREEGPGSPGNSTGKQNVNQADAVKSKASKTKKGDKLERQKTTEPSASSLPAGVSPQPEAGRKVVKAKKKKLCADDQSSEAVSKKKKLDEGDDKPSLSCGGLVMPEVTFDTSLMSEAFAKDSEKDVKIPKKGKAEKKKSKLKEKARAVDGGASLRAENNDGQKVKKKRAGKKKQIAVDEGHTVGVGSSVVTSAVSQLLRGDRPASVKGVGEKGELKRKKSASTKKGNSVGKVKSEKGDNVSEKKRGKKLAKCNGDSSGVFSNRDNNNVSMNNNNCYGDIKEWEQGLVKKPIMFSSNPPPFQTRTTAATPHVTTTSTMSSLPPQHAVKPYPVSTYDASYLPSDRPKNAILSAILASAPIMERTPSASVGPYLTNKLSPLASDVHQPSSESTTRQHHLSADHADRLRSVPDGSSQAAAVSLAIFKDAGVEGSNHPLKFTDNGRM